MTNQCRRRTTKTKERRTKITSRQISRSNAITMRMTMTRRRRTTTVMKSLTRSREEASDEDNDEELGGGQQSE